MNTFFSMHISSEKASYKNRYSVNKMTQTIDCFSEINVSVHILQKPVECKYCKAIKFPEENAGICCQNGKVKLTPFKLPKSFVHLYANKDYARNSRAYNSMFAFTSIGAKVDKSVHDGFNQCYRINGSFYHRMGSLQPGDGCAKFAQIYLFDPDYQLSRRKSIFSNSNSKFIQQTTSLLMKSNPYVKIFDIARRDYQHINSHDYSIQFHHLDDKIYNKPTIHEIAAIIRDGDEGLPRDIAVRGKNSLVHKISDLHSAYDPLQYPLLFPQGTQGWTTNIKNGNRKITQREFYCFHGFSRKINQKSNPLELIGPLAQQFWVDQYCKIEFNRLQWLRKNPKKLRLATMYDLQNSNVSQKVGKVILPSSFTGSPRYFYENFLDAMAGVRFYGCTTMTANPNWEEIQSELNPGESAMNRPMLIARVFKQKLMALIDTVNFGDIFGKVKAHIGTIEFQKRGLPHAHLLFILDEGYKFAEKNPSYLNQFIFAEIPDKEKNPVLHKRVCSHMLHKPCHLVNSQCTDENGNCKSYFPKDFVEQTSLDESGFPVYRRRNDGRFVTKRYNGKKININNNNVVPYNPTLLLKFNCHINVEAVSSTYLFNYLHKGVPRSSISINKEKAIDEGKYDEIKKFITGRYISAGDSCWRLLILK